MTRNSWFSCLLSAIVLLLVGGPPKTLAQPEAGPDLRKAQITILYDAFGKTSAMIKDWGFAALIEYGGKRVLFDTGNNPDIFPHNVKANALHLPKPHFLC